MKSCAGTLQTEKQQRQGAIYAMLFYRQLDRCVNVPREESVNRATQQPPLFAKTKNACYEERVEAITQTICNMAAKDMMAISTSPKYKMGSWGYED